MLNEFKSFIMRGNVVDLAVGIIMGAAFTKIVSSLVEDVLMPPIGLLTGGTDFSNLFINLSGTPYDSLKAAQAAGAATINYGVFLNAVIQFLIVSFAIFMLIRLINRLHPSQPPKPTTRNCDYCLSGIAEKATRCPHCTSQLSAA